MFNLLVIALLQFATLNSNAPVSKIGSSGWDIDAVATPTSKIGSSGWDIDAVKAPSTNIGSSGWDID